MNKLPEIDEQPIECGEFRVYTNRSGEIFIGRGITKLKISPGYRHGEIVVTANAALTAHVATPYAPAISACKEG